MSSGQANQSNSQIARVRELFDARFALAKLEVDHDIACGRRLGIVAGSGAVVAIVGLTLLTLVFSDSLANLTNTEPLWWQFGFGIVMTGGGAAAIYLGWTSFRRDFSGLTETLDELREDRAWLSEMASEVLHTTGVNPPADEQ